MALPVDPLRPSSTWISGAYRADHRRRRDHPSRPQSHQGALEFKVLGESWLTLQVRRRGAVSSPLRRRCPGSRRLGTNRHRPNL